MKRLWGGLAAYINPRCSKGITLCHLGFADLLFSMQTTEQSLQDYIGQPSPMMIFKSKQIC